MVQFIRETRIETADGEDPRVAQIAERLPDVAPELLAALYGDGAPAQCVVLVDATLRREVVGLFDLDTLDHPVMCMFDGAARQEYADVAPYLIDLTIREPKTDDLRFHRDFFDTHWGVGTSVIVQSDVAMTSVRHHLRRFTQLPVLDDGKRRFFRFWDGRILPGFLRVISLEAERVRRMMMTDNASLLHYVTPDGQGGAIRFSPDVAELTPLELKPMFLRWSDFTPIADARRTARLDRMVGRIEQDFAKELQGRDHSEIKRTALQAVKRFETFGFRTHAHLHFFATWSVLYGIGFEENDSTGRLQEICRSKEPEPDRFRAFRKWFDSFKVET